MRSFRELYEQMLREGTGSLPVGAFDPHHLDCLLNPDRYPPVWRIGHCDCGHEQHAPCEQACLFDALKRDAQGNIAVQNETCTGCLACVERCAQGKLTASRDIMPVLRRLVQGEQPVYALIAPAFIGQFSQDVTPGRLRAAFKNIGFAGMIEVALFADILTLKEAFEFDHHIHTDNDFMLASCCCPIWIAMIRKLYNQLVGYIPPSVSPMVACGRAIKRLYPDAATVFIGPCFAK